MTSSGPGTPDTGVKSFRAKVRKAVSLGEGICLCRDSFQEGLHLPTFFPPAQKVHSSHLPGHPAMSREIQEAILTVASLELRTEGLIP